MSELSRILAIPRDVRDGLELVEKWTDRFRAPGGTWMLHPHQALALEYAQQGGVFLPITVGGGKTLLGALLGDAAGYEPEDVIVLCPPALVDEAAYELPKYEKHFTFRAPRYVPYTELSNTDSTDLLDELAPKFIIADEAHALKNISAAKASARARRFVRYMRAHPETRFAAMSATFTDSSIKDFAHLVMLALKDGSPLPQQWMPLESWSRVIDVDSRTPATPGDYRLIAPLVNEFAPDEQPDEPYYQRARRAFAARLRSAPGVVVTDKDSSVAQIVIRKWTPKVPAAVKDASAQARLDGLLPNGTIVDDPWAKAMQLSQGFYYYPDWSAIGRDTPDLDWIYARREYEQRLRFYQMQGKRGLDSRALLERRLVADPDSLPGDLVRAHARWMEQAHKPEPPQVAEWVSDDILLAGLELASTLPNCLVWSSFTATHQRLQDLGARVFWPGERPTGGGVVVVSVASHSTGLNLQDEWNNNLVLCPPSGGGRWQQLLGRTDRYGQKAPEVGVWVANHTPELRQAMVQARKRAKFLETTQELTQKLMHARYE